MEHVSIPSLKRNQSKQEFPRAASSKRLAESVVIAACGHQRALMCQIEGEPDGVRGGR